MTLNEIKSAIANGNAVCWANGLYDVKECKGSYYIVCNRNGDTIGLTHADGVTLNGKESDFFIK